MGLRGGGVRCLVVPHRVLDSREWKQEMIAPLEIRLALERRGDVLDSLSVRTRPFGQHRRHQQSLRVGIETGVVHLQAIQQGTRLVEAMQTLQYGCNTQRGASLSWGIRQQARQCRLRFLFCSHHHQEKADPYGDIEVESFEGLPVLECRQRFLDIDELVATLREGPADGAIVRREARGVSQGEVGSVKVITLHLQYAQVVQQARRRRRQPQGAVESCDGLVIAFGGTQCGAEVTPVLGNGGLCQGEGVEYSHCLLVPALGIEDLAEYRQRARVMVVRT